MKTLLFFAGYIGTWFMAGVAIQLATVFAQ
jgi:predicted metal-binding membrane protein